MAAVFPQCVYEVIILVILNGAAPDCTHQGALRKMSHTAATQGDEKVMKTFLPELELLMFQMK